MCYALRVIRATADFPVIVTDGLWRKSVSAIRSLGKAGFHVHVMGDSWLTTGFWSRYADARILAPSAAKDPDGFGHALLEELKRPGQSRPVLIPMEDATLGWISAHAQELANLADFLLPPTHSLAIASDKAKTMQAALEAGIPHPRTVEPKSPADIPACIASLGTKAWVAKPRTSSGSAGVIFHDKLPVRGPIGETEEFWTRHWRKHGPLLLQERIPHEGKAVGVSLLMNRDSECLAAFAHQRIREYPTSGGPSTDRISIHDERIISLSIAFLKKLEWRGIAMLEWKLDPTTGEPRLLEINPRFWGSLELAARSGVDFPTLYVRAARDEAVAPVNQYRTGVRCRWMIPGEVLRYLSTPRAERESLREFLRGLPGIAEEWDGTDLRGTLATIICSGLLALHPRYWKYLRRR